MLRARSIHCVLLACAWTGYAWWPCTVTADDIGALSLKQAEELLSQHNFDLRASRAAAAAAQADLKTAGEAPNPQLSVNTSSIDSHLGIGAGAPRDKRVDSVIRIDQPFERGGKRRLREAAAGSALQAAELDVTDTWRMARLSLANAYYDLKYAQEASERYRTTFDLQQQSLAATEQMQQAGAASTLDVSRLRIEVARAATDVAHAQQAERSAQIALATILGRTDDSAQLAAVDEWPDLVTAVKNTDAPAIEQRPDVAAAAARMHQAEQNIDLAKSQRTRDVTLGVQYEHDMTASGGPPNSWGLGFSVPLFLRHRYQGEIARATADRGAAQIALEDTKAKALHDREQAAADLAAAAERLRRYQDAVLDEARRTAEAADYAFRRGALKLTDLLDARRSLLAIELEDIDAHSSYAKALAAWRAASSTEDFSVPQ